MFRFAQALFQNANGLKIGLTGVSLLVGGGVLLSNQTVSADSGLNPPNYPWNHSKPWQAFDHASIRRGFLVYKQVCATCHSLDRIAWRNLVDVAFTEAEIKQMASEVEYKDGPDQEGDMFDRPGKLSDYLPRPYPNENAARFANNGALPPDLSLVVKARERHEDYIFALLTGYREPPAGIVLREGLHYNPYFPGGAIAMAQPLSNGQVEYDDGTENSISQMAKDVSTFLAWLLNQNTITESERALKP
jgi:ubiquinol-cytochrome c reductase cytochrome c1 subunit